MYLIQEMYNVYKFLDVIHILDTENAISKHKQNIQNINYVNCLYFLTGRI